MYPLNDSLVIETPIGFLLAIVNDRGLFSLRVIESKEAWMGQFVTLKGQALLADVQLQLTNYFKGSLDMFSIPLDLRGTTFQQLVWSSLCTVPYGDISTYKVQAESIGKPKAFRAVGHANALNPISIIIPCHRIVRTDKKIGGYAYGYERKAWLIAHEAKHRPTLLSSI